MFILYLGNWPYNLSLDSAVSQQHPSLGNQMAPPPSGFCLKYFGGKEQPVSNSLQMVQERKSINFMYTYVCAHSEHEANM